MPWCDRCDRYFGSDNALWQHKEYSNMHHVCYKCDRDFTTAHGLVQHYVQSRRHAYCQRCDEDFDDLDDLHEHYEDEHWYCDVCDTIFDTEAGLHEHRRQKHDDRYCVPCKRMFLNENSLQQHQRSATHRGRTVECPMPHCGRAFVSPAALVLHLESGSCASGMTRANVDDLVKTLDRGGIITNPNRLIAGGPGARPRVTDQWATERAWNGAAYECYLCHRAYASLAALNAHLRSPAHGEKLYRCPTRGWRGCGAEFRTLSGFFQHVESGQCGVWRFESEMKTYIEGLGLSSSLKRLTL